jgi:exodeoxyribonuclease VII small subunit
MTAKKVKAEVDFEQALQELEKIVDDLESGELTLEQSIDAFERGIALSKLCQKRLEAAEERVKKVLEKAGGEIDLELFESPTGIRSPKEGRLQEGENNSNG